MFCYQPMLRPRLSTVNLKNLLCIVEKYHVENLTVCKNIHLKNIYRIGYRNYSTEDKKKDVTVSEGQSEISTATTFETIKENTKTAWYGGVILAGLGVTGVLFFTIFKELFSSQSPNSVRSKAFDRCVSEPKVVDMLGDPIKTRGRRVSYLTYEQDGVSLMRMTFPLNGSRKKGAAHLEVEMNDKGSYDYRYLFVQLVGYPHTTIVLEDNRNKAPSLAPLPSLDDLKLSPLLS